MEPYRFTQQGPNVGINPTKMKDTEHELNLAKPKIQTIAMALDKVTLQGKSMDVN